MSRLGERAEAGEALTDVAGVSGVSISSVRVQEHCLGKTGERYCVEDNEKEIGQQRDD